MSVGVLSIGLLGVVSLIPLAQHKAMQGTLEDRKALAGRRAFREFHVRDLGNMRRWIGDTNGAYVLPTIAPLERPSFCIDPQLFAQYLSQSGVVPTFPMGLTPGVGVMRRITIDTFAGSGVPMIADQAEEVFVFRDDLTYDRPTEGILPPEQVSLGVDNTSDGLVSHSGDVPLKRQADKSLSWMATLVPEPIVGSDIYHLSVVVFFKRLPDPTLPQESVVAVNGFYGAGYSGGDMELVAPSGVPSAAVHLQELKTGDWLMLQQQRTMAINVDLASGVTNPVDHFRWYRVTSIDEPIEGNLTREVTLQGPDWDASLATRAILVRDVVAVYEKTVRLRQ